MPATVEALFILLVFVMPGFITVRARQLLVPTVEKTDALQITLQSLTVGLLYLPLWLAAGPALLPFRASLIAAAAAGSLYLSRRFWVDLGVFLFLSVLLPSLFGVLWAVASWNDWQQKLARRVYPWLRIPVPVSGVGESLWDRLWLNRQRRPWLTVYMKDGRIYVGQGMEFSLSPQPRELFLGANTRLYDKNWKLKRDLSRARGEGVWIPVSEVSSIELHE